MEKDYVLKVAPSRENKDLEKFLFQSLKKLNKLFGVDFKNPPRVLLIDSREDFDSIYGSKTGDSFLAWSSNGDFIFVINPKKIRGLDKNEYLKILYHELFHVFQQRISGWTQPSWLGEGAASYFSKQIKKEPTRDEMLSIFSDKPENIYSVGYFWVKILVKKFGEKKVIRLLKEFRRGSTNRDFKSLFKKIFGVEFSLKKMRSY